MRQDVLITIVMPVFNMEEYISYSIESVINQSYSNWELIVIDDGSTDNSKKVIDFFCENDKRIKIFTQENHGVSYARNRGITLGRGDYLVFLDSDDCLDKKFLENMLMTLEENNYGMVFCKYQKIRNGEVIEKTPLSLNILPNESFAEYLLKNRINSYAVMGTMYNLNSIKEKGIKFTEGCSLGEDFEFIFKIASQEKVGFCAEYLYQYNYREDSAYHGQISYKKILDRIHAYERAHNFILKKGIIDKEIWLLYIQVNLNDFRNFLKRQLWQSLCEGKFFQVIDVLEEYNQPLVVSSRPFQYLIDSLKLLIINSKNITLWRLVFSLPWFRRRDKRT